MYDPSMRVLTVLELLQARERVTGAELARRLEVSPRTVQRYVARLQDLGIPVESTRGVGGAYRLRPGFRLPPLMLTDDEALALALGLRALRHLGLAAFAPAAESAGAKLARVLPPAVAGHLRDIEDAVDLDADPWTVETSVGPLVKLATAVRARRVIAFDYRAHSGACTRREVEPYGIVHLDGRWYVVGHCRTRQALRSFRVDRVGDPDLLDVTFEKPAGLDARTHLHDTLPFVQGPHRIEVWLDLPPDRARTSLTPWRVTLAPDGDGTVIRCTREALEPFAAMLLGLGCAFHVRSPDALRAALRTVARRALRAART